MSERGQKIFKIIVWTIIVSILLFNIIKIVLLVNRYSNIEDQKITKEEWGYRLSESFGTSISDNMIEETDIYVTGEFAAQTVMNAFGRERLLYLSNNELTDEAVSDLAVEYGVIPQNLLEKDLTIQEAENIITNAMNLYWDPEYYPKYFEADTKVFVNNADLWEIKEINNDSLSMTASISENVPQVGEVIMYTDDCGIAHARRIEGINLNSGSEYNLQLSEIQDMSEIFNSISFSGPIDFRYMLEKGNNASSDEDTYGLESTNTTWWYDPFTITTYAAESRTVVSSDTDWFEGLEDDTAVTVNSVNTCDLELNVEIKETDKNGKQSEKVTSYIKISTDEGAIVYKFEIDESGIKPCVEVPLNEWVSYSFSDDEDENKTYTPNDLDKLEAGISANVKISDFSLCTSGYWQTLEWDDKKNYIEIGASAEKVEISSSAKLNYTKEFLIGSLDLLPIEKTGGAIAVKINLYLVFSATGELKFCYEIEDPSVGVKITPQTGIVPNKNHSSVDSNFTSKIELSGGFIGEAGILVCGDKYLANPRIDVRGYATISEAKYDENIILKEEYEDNPCLELLLQYPVVKLDLSSDGTIIKDFLGELNININTIDLIKKDSDCSYLKKKCFHIEYNLDGSYTVYPYDLDDGPVCTHIDWDKMFAEQIAAYKNKNDIGDSINNGKSVAEQIAAYINKKNNSIKDNISNNVNNKVEEIEDDAKNLLEEKLEDFLEKLLGSCDGC